MNLLEKSFESLADFPKRYPLAPEARTHGKDIRHMHVGSYRVLYWIIDDTVSILRVRHAAQRPFKPGRT